MLEKTLESPLESKEIQPVHHKGNQSWIFIGRTDVEAVTPILWLPELKSWLIWKDPDAWKDWRQEEKGATEHETGWMVSLTQWTWVCINSGSWWWTRRPGVRWFMGLQRVRHDWATELSWSLLQGIFLTQELNRDLLHCRWTLYQLSYQRSLGLPWQSSG